jgi:hypothetical protein
MKNSAINALTRALFSSNSTAPEPTLTMFGLPNAYGTTDGTVPYGGLSRTTYPMWRGLDIPSGIAATRESIILTLLRTVQHAGGQAPDFAVCDIATWAALQQSFQSQERYLNDPASRWGKDDPANSGFRGLLLGDTPIFFDLNAPPATMYIFNSRFITYVIHEDASFAWSGWYSTIPQGQVASVGLTITAINLVCSQPRTGAIVHGITGGAAGF